MIAEFGHFALVLACAVGLIQSIVPVWGVAARDPRMMAVAPMAAVTQFLLVGVAFGALVYAYVVSDFSLLNVAQNSNSHTPLLYRVTGTWGNHEGSMLLWVLVLTLFGSLVALFSGNLPDRLRALVLAVQGWIGTAFFAFILLTSNPFIRTAVPPIEGNELNPVLQDIGLAIHPPLLYLGYVGCSISFAFAIAALIDGRIEAAWARWVRPWTLTAWMFLTAGIAMGSYWAYYELGWGGWWFWDPVENASFMPWLAATALLHSASVMEKRDALKVWTVLLAILTFSLSLLGTFLVRSGVLTSVHTFAADPARGVFILGILTVFIGGALALFAFRSQRLAQGGAFAPISREGSLVLNNLFLTAACASVLIGTLYPLALESLTGERISVGAPFFNLTFGPLMVPLLVAVPFGPLLAWKRGDLYAASQRLMVAFGAALLVAVIVLAISGVGNLVPALGIGLAVWLIVGALTEFATRIQLFRVPARSSLGRAIGLPRSAFGMTVAHLALGVTLLGIMVSTTWETETIRDMRAGSEPVTVAGRSVSLDSIADARGPGFAAKEVHFTVREGERELGQMVAEKRTYFPRGTQTTEAAIRTFAVSQLYVSLGDITDDGVVTVRVYWKPWITLIWIGALLMVAGGILSLSDRRFRVGLPKSSRRLVAAAPAE